MSMEERRRRRGEMPGGSVEPESDRTDALDAERAETSHLLDEVDAITRRALEGDSLAFLRAGRQQGGQ